MLERRPRGVLIDAGGTLLHTAAPLADVYVRFAAAHGVVGLSPALVKQRFKAAFSAPLPAGQALRYVGDGRDFWRRVVAHSTGCDDEALFDALFHHFADPSAWAVADGAADALARLRAAGVKTALVSNFDTRLRPLLHALALADAFDAVVISAEVLVEKPDPRIYSLACSALGLRPADCLHAGDDEANDVGASLQAGVGTAWLWERDVGSFKELADRVLSAAS